MQEAFGRVEAYVEPMGQVETVEGLPEKAPQTKPQM
jgi:hypothetical protein